MLKKLKGYIAFLLSRIKSRIKENRSSFFLSLLIVFSIIASFLFARRDLVENIFFSFIFFFSLLIPGYAVLSTRYFGKLTSLEKFCFSFGLSSFFYAFLAIISTVFAYEYRYFFNLFFLLAINAIGIIYILSRKSKSRSTRDRRIIIQLTIIFLSFVVFLQIFITLPFKMPDPLPDGPYVFKNSQNLHVKIQALTGNLPADNFVPFVFSQFLLQKFSFEKNRPMLPGQEVSNRTVLMGLDSVFFLSIFHNPQQAKSSVMERYIYVDTLWPDVGKLGNDNKAFAIFLNLGIILNSLFLFTVFLLVSRLFKEAKAKAVISLFLLFPYTVSQVIFTWPKFLMAYFLITALYLVVSRKIGSTLFPFALSMAYHSHPSAMIYIGFIMIYWIINNYEIRSLKKAALNFSKIFFVFAALIAPWVIWTKFIIKIPSDLISQNLVSESYSPYHLIKTRLINLLYLFVPWITKVSDFKTKITYEMNNYFPGAVGVYIFICYFYILRYFRKYFWEIIFLVLGPLVVLILPWGKVMGGFAVLFAHPSVPLFFAISAILFSKYKKWTVIFVSVQALLSFYVLWYGVYNLPLQLDNFHISKVFLIFMITFQVIWFFSGLKLLVEKPESVTNYSSKGLK